MLNKIVIFITKDFTVAQAKNGDNVSVHYTGKLSDGSVFDSSENRDPLEFEIGAGQVIKGFEDGVTGMEPGDSKKIEIPVADAYGTYRDDMVVTVSRKQFPEEVNPEVGQLYEIPQPNDQVITAQITNIEGTDVTLDANHPLAGKDLTFELELVEIK